jgi:hypothetical protein
MTEARGGIEDGCGGAKGIGGVFIRARVIGAMLLAGGAGTR